MMTLLFQHQGRSAFAATALLLAAAPAPALPDARQAYGAESPLHAELVVLNQRASSPQQTDDTQRLLEALEADGRLILERPSFDPEILRPCLGEEPEPSDERSACIRSAIPSTPREAPVVVLAIGDTRERGSWQRLECIGPRSAGFQRTIHIRDFDHPRPDISEGVKAKMLACLREGLA